MPIENFKITNYLTPDLISLDLKSKTKSDVLMELSKLIKKSSNILSEAKEICAVFVERESLGSTGIGKSIAIPHAKTELVKTLTIAFGISKNPIDFKSLDQEPVRIFFVFASPKEETHVYLKVLARISRIIRNENVREELYNCKTPNDVIECIDRMEMIKHS